MSRGFVKEDDREDLPFVPPRAYLPAGAVNYVTPRGMSSLLAERAALVSEKQELPADLKENDYRIAMNFINARMSLLEERISSAVEVDLSQQPPDEVRFGATVTVRVDGKGTAEYQIVGVDEADIRSGRLSYLSPMAQRLTGRRIGDVVEMQTPAGVKRLAVEKIVYS